jgi:predicted metal-dependent hydrolase
MNIHILIILLILIMIYLLFKMEKYEVTYVKSNVDGQTYLVRDLKDKQQAADLLANIRKNILTIVNYVDKNKTGKYKEYEQYIDQLKDRIQNVVISESSEDNGYTSYSVNKGEQLVFCLRSKYNNKLYNINLLMYVVLHEMSHIASPTYGHGPPFKKIFAFLTNVAIELNLYHKLNFNKEPTEYCGLLITDSII